MIYGRSDAVLNPGGVRIGTAEIYRQVEQLAEIEEGLSPSARNGITTCASCFSSSSAAASHSTTRCATKSKPASGPTPRRATSRPRSSQVADIPRTISGKITELAVRDIIHGRSVKNKDALANPEALKLFENIPALQT